MKSEWHKPATENNKRQDSANTFRDRQPHFKTKPGLNVITNQLSIWLSEQVLISA